MTEKHPIEELLCLSKLIIMHEKVSELAALINEHVSLEIDCSNYGITDCEEEDYTEEEWADEELIKYKPDKTRIGFTLYIAGKIRPEACSHSEHDNLDDVIKELSRCIEKAIQKNNRPKSNMMEAQKVV